MSFRFTGLAGAVPIAIVDAWYPNDFLQDYSYETYWRSQNLLNVVQNGDESKANCLVLEATRDVVRLRLAQMAFITDFRILTDKIHSS